MPTAGSQFVLIDTCIWVEFFNKPQSQTNATVDSMLRTGSAVTIGPILTEVLQGCRRDAEANWVASLMLASCRVIDPKVDHWCEAARLARQLASRGHTLPLTDLVIAAISLAQHIPVYTTDPHFKLIPQLATYSPL